MNERDKSCDWLLLLYLLPARQAQARVQAWRRLQRVGAVSLKNSAYVLPLSAEAREDFEWIKNDIVALGGQAMVLAASAPDQATHTAIVATFQAARSREFADVAREASSLAKRASRRRGNLRHLRQAVRRLRERFDEVSRVDFFPTPERDRAADLLMQIDREARREPMKRTVPSMTHDPARYRGKVWVTRPRPGVDRMSSAWLIRRFIDPNATFRFGHPAKLPNAVPFDTFAAEFGHHATQCTFETLCARFGITDAAVRWIGRIVHDLDLKENVYAERDTMTVGRVVEGLRRANANDDALLTQGISMFEALYRSYAGRQTVPSAGRRRRTRIRGGQKQRR
jgi:hypothetical protein